MMKLSRRIQLALVLAAGLATHARAGAQTAPTLAPPTEPAPPAAPGSALLDERRVRSALLDWGCEPLGLLALGERWLAACGTAGVFVVAARTGEPPTLIERRTAGGPVSSLFTRDGVVWVETVHRDARPLSDLAGLAAPSAGPPTSQLGTAPLHGAPSAAPFEGPQRPYPATLTAPAPSLTTPERSDSTWAPSRVGDLLMAEVGVRPFLPLKSQKFALLSEFAVSYRGARPWYVQARVLPLGLGVGGPHNVVLFGGSVVAGYDQQYFSVGVGIGAARRGSTVESNENGVYSEHFEQNLRFSVTQAARLGALDGLHLAAQSSFVLLTDHWALAFFELKGQIPINRETWLTPAGGGGGQTGFFYVEMGLRRLLRGDRGRGSLFLRPSVGTAAVDTRTANSSWHPGPMVGVHLEWRQ